jgi:hypothetical protein
MGKTVRREYIEIPANYWVSSVNVEYITKRKKCQNRCKK